MRATLRRRVGRPSPTGCVYAPPRPPRASPAAEFKLKYSGSALGYVWSVVKPLALFTMLYAVFGRVFKLGAISHYYPVSLLIGIVLFTFFSDATIVGDVLARRARVAAAQARRSRA